MYPRKGNDLHSACTWGIPRIRIPQKQIVEKFYLGKNWPTTAEYVLYNVLYIDPNRTPTGNH